MDNELGPDELKIPAFSLKPNLAEQALAFLVQEQQELRHRVAALEARVVVLEAAICGITSFSCREPLTRATDESRP